MTDQYFTSLMDHSRNISFDTAALLTNSTINALHFPGLTSSGISDSPAGGNGNRRDSLILDGIGMCESMTESFCSNVGQDESVVLHPQPSDATTHNGFKSEGKDSLTQRKRRSRKAQYDALFDSPSLDKIEMVNIIDDQNEGDDVWLCRVPHDGLKTDAINDNIFSWVHKEFKTNDINASKHRLLCKLDDMSHARTIRSISCHNFLDDQRTDGVKRSSPDQHVRPEFVKNGRLSSPLRAVTPLFNDHETNQSSSSTSSFSLGHSVPITMVSMLNGSKSSQVAVVERSGDAAREPDRERFDYTDVEVMAKLQLENLRQAERQSPLSKHFGGSNASLASTNSSTSVSTTYRSGNKPPVAPKSIVTRHAVPPNSYHRVNTQSGTKNGYERAVPSESQTCVGPTNRTSLLPSNSVNHNRTRPPTTRPLQVYRGSQTSFQNNVKVPSAPSSIQRNGKRSVHDVPSALKPSENGLLHDVSNQPLTVVNRLHVGSTRRTMVPAGQSMETIAPTRQSVMPRSSSSSLSQGRKSGIPTVGKPQRPSTATVTRLASSTVYRLPTQSTVDSISSWNDGCY